MPWRRLSSGTAPTNIHRVVQDLLDLLRWAVPALVLLLSLVWLFNNWGKLDRQGKTAVADGFDLCKQCGYDIRGGLEKCPECGSVTPAVRRRKLKDLQSKLPPDSIDPRVPGPHEESVVVFTTDQGMLAEILRQHLDARGIPARIVKPNAGDSILLLQRVSASRLVVWSDDQERAESIIKAVWDDAD